MPADEGWCRSWHTKYSSSLTGPRNMEDRIETSAPASPGGKAQF